MATAQQQMFQIGLRVKAFDMLDEETQRLD
jgi:hypothetical protein